MSSWIKSKKITIYILLVGGVLLASIAESIIGTALSFGKLDMLGDLYTTPDEFSWLEISYTAAKLCGFVIVPALFARFRPLSIILIACIVMTSFSLLMTYTNTLPLLIGFRAMQGLAGGILLVSGQSSLFIIFSGKSQPLTQLIFTFGSVVVSTTLASALQGWMVDALTWKAIFLTSFGFGISAILLLTKVPSNIIACSGTQRKDAYSLLFFAIAAFFITYISQEGSRWNWFESLHIVIFTCLGGLTLLVCFCRWIRFNDNNQLVDLSVFKNPNFSFGFAVSFIAGIALLGSTWLIPGLMLNVLGITATQTGWLISLGGIIFLATLTLAMLLITYTKIPPLSTVPLGIFLIMMAMWLFSNSTSESGTADLLIPILTRGAGFGFLILSLTIYALGCLKDSLIVQGVALFTTFRQLGGLFGVALLQRYLDYQNALNKTVLSSHLVTGGTALTEKLKSIQMMLQSKGMSAGEAAKAAMFFLQKTLIIQTNTLSYDEAFLIILIVFLVAAPILILFKNWLSNKQSKNLYVVKDLS